MLTSHWKWLTLQIKGCSVWKAHIIASCTHGKVPNVTSCKSDEGSKENIQQLLKGIAILPFQTPQHLTHSLLARNVFQVAECTFAFNHFFVLSSWRLSTCICTCDAAVRPAFYIYSGKWGSWTSLVSNRWMRGYTSLSSVRRLVDSGDTGMASCLGESAGVTPCWGSWA